MERTRQRHLHTRCGAAKRLAPKDRAKCFKQLGKISITSTAGRDPDLARDDVGPIPAQDIIPDEEPIGLKYWGITLRKFEITQDVLWSRDIMCQRLDETLPGF